MPKLNTFDEMYQAALAKNIDQFKEGLKRALPRGILYISDKCLHTYCFNIVSLLASEGKKDAIEFLLEHITDAYDSMKQDADYQRALNDVNDNPVQAVRNQALLGYAISNNTAEVSALMEAGADVKAAITGYALGGHVSQINEALGQINLKSIKDIVGDNPKALTSLLSEIAAAISGYEYATPLYQSEIKQLKQKINDAARDYAQEGKTAFVEILLSKETNKKVTDHTFAYAAYGYALSGNQNALLNFLEQTKDKQRKRRMLDYAIRGAAQAGYLPLVDRLLKDPNASKNAEVQAAYGSGLGNALAEINYLINNPDKILKNYAIRGYAQVGNEEAVNALLTNGASRNYATRGYAQAGNEKAVNALLAKGASPDYAILGYTKGNHQDALNRLIVQIETERQKSRRNVHFGLMGLAAIFLTPLSLLITVPLWWFKVKNHEPIQDHRTSTNQMQIVLDNNSVNAASTNDELVRPNSPANVVYVNAAKFAESKSTFWTTAKAVSSHDKAPREAKLSEQPRPTSGFGDVD